MDIFRIKETSIEPVPFEAVKGDTGSKYWILLTPEELQAENGFFRFPQSTIEECLNSKQYPKLEVYDSMSFGVLNIMEKTAARFVAKELNFYLTGSWLIFVFRDGNKVVDNVKKEIIDNLGSKTNYFISLSKILYLLLDKLTSVDNIILSRIEGRIAKLEEQVMENSKKDFTPEIVELRKQLLFLKRHYEPLIIIAEDLEENQNGVIEENSVKYYTILANRIQRLNNNVLNLRDYITQVREAYQAQVDISLNKIMKLFTVITSIFLPLSLIAGWYGMNFKYMPELQWSYGYPFVFALSGIVAVAVLYYFKRHNYI